MIKYIVPYLLLLSGAVIFGNAVIASVLSNLSTGVWMTYGLGLLLILCGIFYPHLPRWMWAALIGLLLVAVTAVCCLFLFGKTDTVTYNEDIVIVLGAGVQGDTPTKSLQNRLDRTLTYHAQNPDALIVVSGAQGPQETVTEAYAMERYLTEHGVPASCILKEEAATSTKENFEYTKALIDEHVGKDCEIAFITTDYHIFRAAMSADRAGFSNVTHAHSGTPWYMIVPSGLRECLAIVKFILFR